MLSRQKTLISVLSVSILLLSACKQSTPPPTPSATATLPPPTATVTATSAPPTAAPTQTTEGTAAAISPPDAAGSGEGELCDNTYFPTDEDTTWTYAGSSSAAGDYTRTDIIQEASDSGFQIATTLKDISYTIQFSCSQAGLIAMDPVQSQLTGLFAGNSGIVSVETTDTSGITFPRDIQPGDTWQQVTSWIATTKDASYPGRFIYNYSAMGLEVVDVPYGTFDAMRLDVVVEVEFGGLSGIAGTYTTSIWMVKDVGIVKSEGNSQIPGIEFTDSQELVEFESP
jgi:hypothetical protein